MINAPQKNIHIYLESNPNPSSLKFVVNEILVPEGLSFDFPDAESSDISPLAKELFEYDFVDRVFFASNFITVTKNDVVTWDLVQLELREFIQEFLNRDGRVLTSDARDAFNRPWEGDQ